MVEVISELLEILYAFFQGYCLQYLYGSFLSCRKVNLRKSSILTAGLYGGFRILLELFLPAQSESLKAMLRLFLVLVVILALAFCFYKAFEPVTVFLTVTFLAVSEISFYLSYVFLVAGCKIFNLWLWLLEKGIFIYSDSFRLLLSATEVILNMLRISLAGFLLYVSLKKIRSSFQEKGYILHRTELYFLVTPGLAGLLICMLLRIITVIVEDGTPTLLYDRQPALILLVPAILLLLLLSILFCVRLFQNMICLNRERNNRILLEKQVDSLQEHLEEIDHVYAGMRSVKHDMKNTLAVLVQLASQEEGQRSGEMQENPQLQTYLAELNQAMKQFEPEFQTGNNVVDILLHLKYQDALRTLPDLQMDADRLLFPAALSIRSYDIGIILGNALDNAIAACRKLRGDRPEEEVFIQIYSFQRGKMFFLEMENSFDGELVYSEGTEFPQTDKADKNAHGIGFSNMKNTAEKYQGSLDWSAEQGVFRLSVMLKNSEEVS